jgi:MauM/NapG family ferredoxin protein
MGLDRNVDRRRFFREGFRELLKPLVKAAEPIENALRQFEAMTDESAASPKARDKAPRENLKLDVWLRPPGALPDQQFRDTCSRCRACVEICPAECIHIDPTGKLGDGAPYINPNAMACVVCDGLKCMHVCPSGALVPTALMDIDMGTAVWNQETCLRNKGEDCVICVEQCPLGSIAIELRGGMIHVHEEGCIGCGVCQQQCPTAPKSIAVVPRGVLGAQP